MKPSLAPKGGAVNKAGTTISLGGWPILPYREPEMKREKGLRAAVFDSPRGRPYNDRVCPVLCNAHLASGSASLVTLVTG